MYVFPSINFSFTEIMTLNCIAAALTLWHPGLGNAAIAV